MIKLNISKATVLSLLLISSYSFAQTETETIVKNMEGFYSSGWEHSNFAEIDVAQCLLVNDHWTSFDKNVKIKAKSISDVAGLDGVYMKVNVIQKVGKSYGHLGMSKSEIIITEILEVDTSRTFSKYIQECGKVKRKAK